MNQLCLIRKGSGGTKRAGFKYLNVFIWLWERRVHVTRGVCTKTQQERLRPQVERLSADSLRTGGLLQGCRGHSHRADGHLDGMYSQMDTGSLRPWKSFLVLGFYHDADFLPSSSESLLICQALSQSLEPGDYPMALGLQETHSLRAIVRVSTPRSCLESDKIKQQLSTSSL